MIMKNNVFRISQQCKENDFHGVARLWEYFLEKIDWVLQKGLCKENKFSQSLVLCEKDS